MVRGLVRGLGVLHLWPHTAPRATVRVLQGAQVWCGSLRVIVSELFDEGIWLAPANRAKRKANPYGTIVSTTRGRRFVCISKAVNTHLLCPTCYTLPPVLRSTQQGVNSVGQKCECVL